MFDIFDSNVIKITRGNSAALIITPIDNVTGDPYILSEGDVVIFTLQSIKTGEKILQKFLTSENQDDGNIVCNLEPEDTLDMPTGEYKYDCLLKTNDGQAVTFISSSFVITEAIGVYTDNGGVNDG